MEIILWALLWTSTPLGVAELVGAFILFKKVADCFNHISVTGTRMDSASLHCSAIPHHQAWKPSSSHLSVAKLLHWCWLTGSENCWKTVIMTWNASQHQPQVCYVVWINQVQLHQLLDTVFVWLLFRIKPKKTATWTSCRHLYLHHVWSCHSRGVSYLFEVVEGFGFSSCSYEVVAANPTWTTIIYLMPWMIALTRCAEKKAFSQTLFSFLAKVKNQH